jgi:transcriptional regulator with XRE-family HTH domain
MTTERLLSFADLLRHFRQRFGLTQEELAAHTGLGVRTISDLERGISRTPRLDTLTRLASTLDLADEDRASFMAAARPARKNFPHAGSTTDLPPQRHLPSPLTPLIGREHEEASITNLLQREDVRLLTLTGAPGIGKTRLAIQVAVGVRPHYIDGLAFVELATIREPALVLPTIAQALGVRDSVARSLREALTEYCASRQLLLVVDNFEQVLEAGALVGELLADCPTLKPCYQPGGAPRARRTRVCRVATSAPQSRRSVARTRRPESLLGSDAFCPTGPGRTAHVSVDDHAGSHHCRHVSTLGWSAVGH